MLQGAAIYATIFCWFISAILATIYIAIVTNIMTPKWWTSLISVSNFPLGIWIGLGPFLDLGLSLCPCVCACRCDLLIDCHCDYQYDTEKPNGKVFALSLAPFFYINNNYKWITFGLPPSSGSGCVVLVFHLLQVQLQVQN